VAPLRASAFATAPSIPDLATPEPTGSTTIKPATIPAASLGRVAAETASGAIAVPAAPTNGAGPEGTKVEEAIARLATPFAPGQVATGAGKPSATSSNTETKGKAVVSDESATDTFDAGLVPGGTADKPGGQVAPPAVAAQTDVPARITRISDGDAKDADAEPQATKVADGPSPSPFAAELAGAAPTTPGLTPQVGAPAAAHGPAHVVENVPISNVPVEIGMKSLAGVNHFEIRLAPDDLGRVDVRLHIDAEGRVKAHLVVERPETLAFLQRDAQQLQQTLEQAGLKTQENGVALSLRNSPSDQGFGQNGGGANDDSPQQSRRGSASGQADAADAITGPTRRLLWPRPSGVDLHI
jgi:hypothetical protein